MDVSKLLELDAFNGAEVVAGEDGLINNVLSVTLVDARDGYKCRQGDFMISTGYPFSVIQDWESSYSFSINQFWEDRLMKLLKILVENGSSGYGLKLGSSIPNLPAKAISFANKNNFPILSLPNELPLSDIIVPAIIHINDKTRYELERTYTIYKQYHQHLKTRGEMADLAKLLYKIMNVPVTIYIRDTDEVIDIPRHLVTNTEIEAIIKDQYIREEIIQRVNKKGRKFTVRWISTEGQLVGGVFLWSLDSRLKTWEKVALEQTAVIAALEIERIKSISATFQRFRNDFLSKLLNGVKEPYDCIFRQASDVNWQLTDNYRVVLLDMKSDRQESNRKGVIMWREKNIILDIMEKELKRIIPDSLIGLDEQNRFAILIPEKVDSNLLIKTKLNKLTECLDVNFLYGGIGRVYSIHEVSISYKEALTSLNMAIKETMDSSNLDTKRLHTRAFSELDVERILFSRSPINEAEALAKEYLHKIISFDQEKDSELLETLKIFLNLDANFTETAEALFIHSNTVRYRINMITELTNLNPVSTKGRILFKLALSVFDFSPLEHKMV